MQTRQLEYFLAVSETLSFTKAAKRFYISQAAMTMQIKSLEEEMGVRLFDRNNRHVSLTPAGSAFVEDAHAILKRTQDATTRARRAETIFTGSLALGYVKGYERSNLGDMLLDYQTRYPNVALTFLRENVADLYDAVLDGNIDLAICLMYSAAAMGGMDYRVIHRYPLSAVVPVSHPLAHRAWIWREELAGYPLVDIKKGSGKYGEDAVITGAFADAGFLPPVAYVSDDIETSILAVSAGMGYALLPGYITDGITMRDRIVVVPIRGEEQKMTIVAAWRKGSDNPALERFISESLRCEG